MANGNSPKRHTARNVGIAILLVIVAGAAAFYYLYLSGGVATLAYQAISSPQTLQSAVVQKINSYPQLGVSYRGNITYGGLTAHYLSLSGSDLAGATLQVPVNVSLMKYMSDERVTVSIGQLPVTLAQASNLSVVGISINNGTTVYVCYKLGAQPYKCAKSSGSPLLVLKNVTGSLGVPAGVSGFHASKVQPSFYNGMPCWELAGNLTAYGAAGQQSGSAQVNFDACFSAQYYLPLTLRATATTSAGANVGVSLSVTNITTATSDAQVTSLPGPLSG